MTRPFSDDFIRPTGSYAEYAFTPGPDDAASRERLARLLESTYLPTNPNATEAMRELIRVTVNRLLDFADGDTVRVECDDASGFRYLVNDTEQSLRGHLH